MRRRAAIPQAAFVLLLYNTGSTPAAADDGTWNEDPFAVDGESGQRVRFYIPPGTEVLMLSCRDMQLFGRATDGSTSGGEDQQLFDKFRAVIGDSEGPDQMTVVAHSLRNRTNTTPNIEKKPAASDGESAGESETLHADLVSFQVLVDGVAVKQTGAVASDSGSLVTITQENPSSETVQFSPWATTTMLNFRSALMLNNQRVHLELRLIELERTECKAGILAEAWGMTAMSQETALLLDPSSATRKEKETKGVKQSKRQRAELEADRKLAALEAIKEEEKKRIEEKKQQMLAKEATEKKKADKSFGKRPVGGAVTDTSEEIPQGSEDETETDHTTTAVHVQQGLVDEPQLGEKEVEQKEMHGVLPDLSPPEPAPAHTTYIEPQQTESPPEPELTFLDKCRLGFELICKWASEMLRPDGTYNDDGPGEYIITADTFVTKTIERESEHVADVDHGTQVRVLEVMPHSPEHRVRARIQSPPGWISIANLKDGHRWAERVAQREAL